MSQISTTARNDQVPHILEVTGIPFQQHPMAEWSLTHGFDVEPGDEDKTLLEHKGTWTAKQRLALDKLFESGEVKTITQVGDDPYSFEDRLDARRGEA